MIRNYMGKGDIFMSNNEKRIISGPDENGVRYFNLGQETGAAATDSAKTINSVNTGAPAKSGKKKSW